MEILIKWSDEDACWVATCSKYRGLSAFGPAPEDAVRELMIVLTAVAELEKEEHGV